MKAAKLAAGSPKVAQIKFMTTLKSANAEGTWSYISVPARSVRRKQGRQGVVELQGLDADLRSAATGRPLQVQQQMRVAEFVPQISTGQRRGVRAIDVLFPHERFE
jgi:hypothetical protein